MGWESSGEEGRKEERKKVEEVCIPVLIKKKSVETRNERKKGERGWADWAHGCRKELVWCVCVCVCVCACVCHSMEEVALAAAVSVASVQRHLTTCIYHSLIEREG